MKVRSATMPKDVTFGSGYVLVASNITPYEEEIDDKVKSGYEYDCIRYTTDEYFALQAQKMASLEEELQAAKILLGVD